jgi:hypothetical protein
MLTGRAEVLRAEGDDGPGARLTFGDAVENRQNILELCRREGARGGVEAEARGAVREIDVGLAEAPEPFDVGRAPEPEAEAGPRAGRA